MRRRRDLPIGLRACAHLRASARQSRFADLLCRGADADRAVSGGVLGGLLGEERRARIRRRWIHAREGSLILRARDGALAFFLRGSLSSYGVFLLFSSFFCLVGRLLLGTLTFLDISFLLCAVALSAALLFLHARQSLSSAIGRSVCLRWLFFRVCMLPQDRLVFGNEQGLERRWLTVLTAALVGGASVLIPPLWIALAIVSLPTLFLFGSVVELMILILLVALPFLQLLPHPTAILAASLILVFLASLFKMLRGQYTLRFGALETLLAVLALLLALGGGEGGLRAVLLLSFYPVESFFSKAVWRARAVLGIALSAGICSLIGILQYFVFGAELRWVDAARFSDIGGRVTSLYSNPNVLAVYLLLTFPLALSAATDRSSSARRRILFALTAALALLCLVLTWSRGAWLGALTAIALLALLLSASSMRRLLLSVIPAVAWAPLLPRNLTNRFISIGDAAESSARYRLYTWRGVLRMIGERPLGIGVGESAFASVYPRFAVSGTESVPHAHSLPLQIAAELGIGGVLCTTAILFCLLGMICTLQRLGGAGEGDVLVRGGICAIAGCLVMGFFDYVWYQSGLFWLFWVTAAAVAGVGRPALERAEYARMEVEGA